MYKVFAHGMPCWNSDFLSETWSHFWVKVRILSSLSGSWRKRWDSENVRYILTSDPLPPRIPHLLCTSSVAPDLCSSRWQIQITMPYRFSKVTPSVFSQPLKLAAFIFITSVHILLNANVCRSFFLLLAPSSPDLKTMLLDRLDNDCNTMTDHHVRLLLFRREAALDQPDPLISIHPGPRWWWFPTNSCPLLPPHKATLSPQGR